MVQPPNSDTDRARHEQPDRSPLHHRTRFAAPWHVANVEPDTGKRRIDFEVEHTGKRAACPACGVEHQSIHDRVRRSWRHLNFFQFEALGLSLCRELPVRQAAHQMWLTTKRLWRRVRHYVEVAPAKDDMSGVRHVGIDETSVERGHQYITVMHDLQARRLLFACPGRDHQTLGDFADELRAHGSDPATIEHACIDMSAAHAEGSGQSLPNAQISYSCSGG